MGRSRAAAVAHRVTGRPPALFIYRAITSPMPLWPPGVQLLQHARAPRIAVRRQWRAVAPAMSTAAQCRCQTTAKYAFAHDDQQRGRYPGAQLRRWCRGGRWTSTPRDRAARHGVRSAARVRPFSTGLCHTSTPRQARAACASTSSATKSNVVRRPPARPPRRPPTVAAPAGTAGRRRLYGRWSARSRAARSPGYAARQRRRTPT